MIKTKYVKLNNGLVVAFAKKDKLHSFGAEIFIKYGSAIKNFYSNDSLYKCEDGIAHLLEHVLIDNAPCGNLGKYFNDNYLEFNGETYGEYTKFYIFGYENFYDNLKMLVDSINNSSFTSEGIEKSKYPVIEEIGEKHNSRNYELFLKERSSLFNTEAYIDGLGTIQNVKDFSYDDLRLVYDTFYQPDNEVIVIYGNYDEDKVLDIIQKCFDSYDRDYRKHSIKEFVDTSEVKLPYTEYVKEDDMPIVSINFKCDISQFKSKEIDRLATYVKWFLAYNFSVESEFGVKIIEDKISPYSVSKTHEVLPYGDKYLIIGISLETEERKEFVKRVIDQINKREMPNELKKEIYKKKMYIGKLIDMDSCHYLAVDFALNYLFNNELEFAKIEDLNEISFKEMEEFINKLDFSNYSVIVRKSK
jgi:predicted Zn-dependent peptidase